MVEATPLKKTIDECKNNWRQIAGFTFSKKTPMNAKCPNVDKFDWISNKFNHEKKPFSQEKKTNG